MIFYELDSKHRQDWDAVKHEVLSHWVSYQRIVFNAAGFSPSAHFEVSEHNDRMPWSPIILCSLTTLHDKRMPIKPWIDYFRDKVELDEDAILCDVDTVLLQREWEQMSPFRKLTTSISKLQVFCQQRGIPTSSEDGIQLKRSDLIVALEAYVWRPKLPQVPRSSSGKITPHRHADVRVHYSRPKSELHGVDAEKKQKLR